MRRHRRRQPNWWTGSAAALGSSVPITRRSRSWAGATSPKGHPAQKYTAWEHHLALTILAGWFVAQTKAEWAMQYGRDGTLAEELGVQSLPALSVANVRELLQAVMPLQQLSPDQARRLVVKHLVDRSRSTRSRLNAQRHKRGPT